MAAARKLRDEVFYSRAQENEDMLPRCDRCRRILSAPGRNGETRRDDHCRVEYIVLPPYGEKDVENCTTLCGECVEAWKKIKRSVIKREQWEVWCERFEGIEEKVIEPAGFEVEEETDKDGFLALIKQAAEEAEDSDTDTDSGEVNVA